MSPAAPPSALAPLVAPGGRLPCAAGAALGRTRARLEATAASAVASRAVDGPSALGPFALDPTAGLTGSRPADDALAAALAGAPPPAATAAAGEAARTRRAPVAGGRPAAARPARVGLAAGRPDAGGELVGRGWLPDGHPRPRPGAPSRVPAPSGAVEEASTGGAASAGWQTVVLPPGGDGPAPGSVAAAALGRPGGPGGPGAGGRHAATAHRPAPGTRPTGRPSLASGGAGRSAPGTAGFDPVGSLADRLAGRGPAPAAASVLPDDGAAWPATGLGGRRTRRSATAAEGAVHETPPDSGPAAGASGTSACSGPPPDPAGTAAGPGPVTTLRTPAAPGPATGGASGGAFGTGPPRGPERPPAGLAGLASWWSDHGPRAGGPGGPGEPGGDDGGVGRPAVPEPVVATAPSALGSPLLEAERHAGDTGPVARDDAFADLLGHVLAREARRHGLEVDRL